MAGQHPPPAPAPAPPRGLPDHRPGEYRYTPPRRGPRRTTGGTVAGMVGLLAAFVVLAVLGFWMFGDADGTTPVPGLGRQPAATRADATDNRLYATGPLTPVACRLPAIGEETASMRRFMDAMSDCLDTSWRTQFGKARMTFTPPKRVFWVESGRSPCGTYPNPGASAFYCPANNTMYVGLRHVVETSGGEPLSNFTVFARVIAHEYGHHVQERAGILRYGHQQMDAAPTAVARMETSRRIELQAQCLAGAFLGAERRTLGVTRRQYLAMMEDVRGRGDERLPADQRDHGSSRNYAGWVAIGFRGDGLAVCNTWTAPPSSID